MQQHGAQALLGQNTLLLQKTTKQQNKENSSGSQKRNLSAEGRGGNKVRAKSEAGTSIPIVSVIFLNTREKESRSAPVHLLIESVFVPFVPVLLF